MGGALAELIDEQFRVSTTERTNRDTSDVDIAPKVVLRNDPGRLAALFINLSASDVYVGLGYDVSSTKGIRISASGGAWQLLWSEDFHLTGREWYGTAAANNSAVLVLEILGMPTTTTVLS